MRSRSIALSISMMLVATLVQVVVVPSAAVAAGGPSVPLPTTPSTSVVSPSLNPYRQDQAAGSQLDGNQRERQALPGSGTTAATSLAPSASWSVASHTGDFSWTYPMRVPPSPGGLMPQLALSYKSSEVDGRTSVTNNQPSWAGEGWSLSPGFVERTYGPCAEDDDPGGVKPPESMGDLCWRSDNATAAYGSSGGALIRDDASGTWRTKSDDGSRIVRFQDDKGILNGDDNGEHWQITSPDGTQYWFGSQLDANSTWTVPVFGDDKNEPCNKATLAESSCVQSYRWLLDKVIDRNGNVIRYFYTKETNKYGMNEKDTAVEYVRGGTLSRIDYGLRDDGTAASGRVLFTVANRCVQNSICDDKNPNNWPDVAWENKCDATPCKHHSPSFWSTQRLASVTTQVLRGGAYDDVDRWDLEHHFPDPGDREKAALWLKSITHTGLVGDGSIEQPKVTFEGTALPNRVDTAADGIAPLYRYRITGIRSESGGLTSITYSSQCTAENKPTKPEENDQWCFPVKWAPKNFAEREDYFHKYVVTKVITSDRLNVQNDTKLSSQEQVVSYEYLGGAAWHRDTSEFTKESKKGYNEFRGFGRVRTRVGAPDNLSGRITMSEERFYRGMDGDKLPNGPDGQPRYRAAKVTDSENVDYPDSDWLQGFGFESANFAFEAPTRLDQPDPPRITKSISKPYVKGPTATRGNFKAYIVRTASQQTFTERDSGERYVTESKTDYDDRGLPVESDDLGDLKTAADDKCTRTVYAPNADKWIINLPGTVETVSVNCDATPVFPKDAISASRNTYDDNGNVKTVEVAKERPAADPDYVLTSTTDYDKYGRAKKVTDALGRATTTVFTPESGPLTQTTVTTPEPRAKAGGLVTTTTIDPAWGVPTKVVDPNNRTTTMVYDALGRKTHAWLPNQPTAEKPSVKFSYLIRNDGASVVTTTTLSPNKTEITSKTLYDGLLRPRQTQTPAMGGGRLIVDTRYDSLGRQWKTTQPYFQSGNIDDTVWLAQDTDIPGHTRTYYDDAGRPSASVYYGGAFEKWRTTTTYGGDRTHVTPPAGGTATTGITNARGELVEQRRYHGPKPEGSYDATFYTYTKAGQLETVTDPMSKVWRYTYDLRGRMVQNEDPDSGISIRTFDDVNKLIKQKDARGKTVAYSYDGLDRKTGVYAEEVTGKPLAEWTYDTAIKGVGKMASSTRWVGENAYTRKVLSYNPLYLPTESSVTIPASEGLLAGSYETFASYNVDGSMSSESFDKAGLLPEESVSYKYDDLGALLESWGGYNGRTFHYGSATEYTRYGEVQRLRLGSGDKKVWQSFYYDTNTRRLARSIVDAEVPSPMQSDTRYTFDPAGTITSIADVPLGQTADVQCFRHDQFRRLTQAWTANVADWTQEEGCKTEPSFSATVSPAPYWHTYTYDKSGNRETETKRAKIGTTNRTYNYDVPGHGHALKSVSTNGGGVNTTDLYEYNANGAVLRKGSQEFTWDVENALTKVVTDGKNTTFTYDADGNRLIRRDPEGTTLYLPGQELRLNVAGGNPQATRYYSHGENIIAVRQDNGSLSWLAGDHQGTGEITIDAGSLQVTRRRQLPFGEPRGEEVPWPTQLGFVGGIKDKSTGLTHLGARDYDPALGRFISVDPVMNPADPQQINGYTYSNNNPITFSDPTGAFCDSCDYYHHNKGEESIWTPVPPNQETKPGAPTGYREAAVTSKIRKASANQRAKQAAAAKAKAGCTELASSGYGMQPCKTASACPPGTVPGNGYLISGCVVPPHRGITSEEAHLILDICGTTEVPIGSQICDGLNAVIYAVEGEWVDAGISVGGMASGIGTAGTAARAADNAANLAKKGCSFTADTKVLMADGTAKPISEVKVGDEVMAADPQSGRVEPRQVTDVIVHLDFVQDLVLENGAKVTTTEDHPFWNESDRQWQRADAIGIGEKLLTATGQRSVFSGLRGETRRVAAAHNLSVQGLSTFYVLAGDLPVLVHNRCPRRTEEVWDHADRGSSENNFMYHYNEHKTRSDGSVVSEEEYLRDSAEWAARVMAPGGTARQNVSRQPYYDGQYVRKIVDPVTGMGGFVVEGTNKVVTFWYWNDSAIRTPRRGR
ncbi:RHS repeat-associated core domain-containing protein [Kibdelosporangium aridum]|uniref:RHS repeat-associated core domain-containing protein n=1 Tax=Kibdelosporangium aridum TaxID=2030 RepID=UPI0035E94C74